MSEIRIVSRKGGKVLILNGRQFYKIKVYKNCSSFWRCSLYKKEKCRGSVTIDSSNNIIKECDLSCEANFIRNDVALQIDEMKQKIIKSVKPIPRIYKKLLKHLKNSGFDLVSNLPTLNSVKHSLYDARNNAAGVSKTVYKSAYEVEVPLQHYQFLLADYFFNGSRILVFCTSETRQTYFTYTLYLHITEFFGDGTFKCCPSPFVQLFTIHGEIGSSNNSTSVVPLVYALLTDKKRQTYETLFNLIKSQIPDWKPKKYHSDFEVAAVKAMAEVFPDVVIRGCYYHWSRAIWRKGKDSGHTKNKPEKRIVSLCSVLPLLPAERILEGWKYIKSECDKQCPNEMSKFLLYIERTWINNNNFNQLISVFAERHRSNNVAESYHSELSKSINKNTVTLIQLLKHLEQIACLAEINVKRYQKNLGKPRTKSMVANDDFIRNIQMELINGFIDVGFALEKLR